MKKFLALIAVIAIVTTMLAVPVSAAGNINPPSSYSTYAEYEKYVQSLLDDDLITQKGADALLAEYNSYNNGTSNGGRFAGCWGRGGGYGAGYGGYGGGCWR